MKKSFSTLAILIGLIFLSANRLRNHLSVVPYPEGLRNWIHVKTGLIGPRSKIDEQFGGFHDIYANQEAVDGYKTYHFPKGSILVFDKHEMIEDSAGNISEGKRKWVDVMTKDSRADSTGGWSFEEFAAESRNDRRVQNFAAFNALTVMP